MGSRGNIGFIGNDRNCVFLYTHWEGGYLDELVRVALNAARVRWDDPAYATRMALTRLIGNVRGDLGYGVDTAIRANQHDVRFIDWERRLVWVVPAPIAMRWYEKESGERPDDLSLLLEQGAAWPFEDFLKGV